MKIFKIVGLGMVILWSASLGGIAGEVKMPVAKNPPKIFIDANRLRRTKTEGGDFDDKRQKVQLEVTVKNIDLNAKKIDGLTAHYWAIGQSASDRKCYKVIDAGEFEVALDNTAAGREIRHKGEDVTLQFDDTGVARFGVGYKGYVLVVLNAAKEVVAVKSNTPAWQAAFERAFALRPGDWCDLNLKPTAAANDDD